MKSKSLLIKVVQVGTGTPYLRVAAVVSDYLKRFDGLDWPGRNRHLQALVLLFPDLPERMYPVLDKVHADLKPDFIASGLMVGQFHPACQEPALRNKEFIPTQAPVPIIAIRRMAFHDILALQYKADWFSEYERRFGHRYRGASASRLDASYVEAYRNAIGLHGHLLMTVAEEP